jgi:hypothetical protein
MRCNTDMPRLDLTPASRQAKGNRCVGLVVVRANCDPLRLAGERDKDLALPHLRIRTSGRPHDGLAKRLNRAHAHAALMWPATGSVSNSTSQPSMIR